MFEVHLAHTSELPADVIADVRTLMLEAFGDDFSDDDWTHLLGGMHALAVDGDELVGHASLVQRRLILDGRTLRAGYLEGLAVRRTRRREGIGAAIMDLMEAMIRRAYDLGALATTDEAIAFYEVRRWRRWQGRTSALTPDGIVRTQEDDDALFVLPVTLPIDVTSDITCDWREGELW